MFMVTVKNAAYLFIECAVILLRCINQLQFKFASNIYLYCNVQSNIYLFIIGYDIFEWINACLSTMIE